LLQIFIIQKVRHEKMFYYNALENCRDKLQEYLIKNKGFQLKKLS